MTGPYMGSTGDQFAGADPRELERLRGRVEQLEQALREAHDRPCPWCSYPKEPQTP